MNLKKARIKSKLGEYFISKQIGISYSDYKLMEKDENFQFNQQNLEKFTLIVKTNVREYRIKQTLEISQAKKWCKNNDLQDKFRELKKNQYEVSKELGIGQSTLCEVLKMSKGEKTTNGVSDDKFLMVYDYLMNRENSLIRETKINIIENTEQKIISSEEVNHNEEQSRKDLLDKIWVLEKEIEFLKNTLTTMNVLRSMEQK